MAKAISSCRCVGNSGFPLAFLISQRYEENGNKRAVSTDSRKKHIVYFAFSDSCQWLLPVTSCHKRVNYAALILIDCCPSNIGNQHNIWKNRRTWVPDASEWSIQSYTLTSISWPELSRTHTKLSLTTWCTCSWTFGGIRSWVNRWWSWLPSSRAPLWSSFWRRHRRPSAAWPACQFSQLCRSTWREKQSHYDIS